MLQAIESFKARRSPCGSCAKHRDKKIFPDFCLESCQEVNNFLISLGDRPHETFVLDQSLILPKYNIKTGYNKPTCTYEQWAEAKAHILKLKKKYRRNLDISEITGVCISSISRLLRLTVGRMDLENWKKIMETE